MFQCNHHHQGAHYMSLLKLQCQSSPLEHIGAVNLVVWLHMLSGPCWRMSATGEWPAAAHLLRSWVRIPPGAWIFVCCECRVLSGRGLCDELIARPEESYPLWCVFVCDLETSRICAPYIYIYDISSLRVNDLTLILLTWRK